MDPGDCECCCYEHGCMNVWVTAFNSFGYIPISGIAGKYGNCMLNFLRNGHTGFYSSGAILHSYQQRIRVNFLHILTNTCYFLNDSHCNEYDTHYFKYQECFLLSPLILQGNILWIAMYSGEKNILPSEINNYLIIVFICVPYWSS